MIEFFSTHTAYALIAAAVLGLIVGSFLNVVAYRLPLMMHRQWQAQCAQLAGKTAQETPRFDLLLPASHCPACGTRIRAHHNVPVLSWLWLRGRCADCGSAISPRYPLIEALTAAASMAVVWNFGVSLPGIAALGLTWTLIAAAAIDLEHTLLPDDLTLPLLWAGLLLSVLGGGVFADPIGSILGAAAGYLALWSVYQIFRVLTGKEGMGYGDFKLLAALGAWLGWQVLPTIILLSALGGTLVGGLWLLVKRHGRDVPIPFGPYLAAAGWLVLLWGEDASRWYLGAAGL